MPCFPLAAVQFFLFNVVFSLPLHFFLLFLSPLLFFFYMSGTPPKKKMILRTEPFSLKACFPSLTSFQFFPEGLSFLGTSSSEDYGWPGNIRSIANL